MIVRDDGASLLLIIIIITQPEHAIIITQPEHAALSGRIMTAWQADGLPQRPTRATIPLATRERDNAGTRSTPRRRSTRQPAARTTS